MLFRPEKKIKKTSFIKISPLEKSGKVKFFVRHALLEIGSSWARYFRSGSYTCDVIHLTQDRFTFDHLLM